MKRILIFSLLIITSFAAQTAKGQDDPVVMLVETNETIAAIADRVGYKDSRYFSQIFTKMVGVKPALYRRLHS